MCGEAYSHSWQMPALSLESLHSLGRNIDTYLSSDFMKKEEIIETKCGVTCKGTPDHHSSQNSSFW